MSSRPGWTDSAELNVLSVSQLTHTIKNLLENGIPEVWVEGEISNFVHHRSGHMYFSVKDTDSQLRCVMFKGRNRYLNFRPANGAQVRVRGTVGVWPPQGAYQFYVEEMVPSGLGALHQAFEALKEKLKTEGLFDQIHKKPIPAYPRKIGVVTSPTGAAIRDIVNVISRRYPIVELVLCPARVQGQSASREIARAIATFQRLPRDERPDLLIVGRGGGSLEDLWPFNEELTARAVFGCSIPVISAVGHEIDFTITDFVADLRAPTPSAGAEEAVPDIQEIKLNMKRMVQYLQRSVLQMVRIQHLQLKRMQQSSLLNPVRLLRERGLHLDRLSDALTGEIQATMYNQQKRLSMAREGLMQNKPERRIHRLRLQLQEIDSRLKNACKDLLNAKTEGINTQKQALKQFSLDRFRHRLTMKSVELKGFDPRSILNRGYAICIDGNGAIISSVETTPPGSIVNIELSDGDLACTINDRRRRSV